MKIITRSEWTSQYPMSTVGTEDMDGPPFFRDKDVKGIQVFLPNESVLFVELSPYAFLENLRKADYSQRGYGDIQYNLAVASNIPGVFSLRGLCNKSPIKNSSTHVSVLTLLGNEEPPTDLLLENLTTCRELVRSRFPNAEDVISNLPFSFDWDQTTQEVSYVNQLSNSFTQTASVHVHEWIETLAYWGYYKGRNDGIYGPVTTNATMLLQADLRDSHLYHKRVDGIYGRYTREAFNNYLKSL